MCTYVVYTYVLGLGMGCNSLNRLSVQIHCLINRLFTGSNLMGEPETTPTLLDGVVIQ